MSWWEDAPLADSGAKDWWADAPLADAKPSDKGPADGSDPLTRITGSAQNRDTFAVSDNTPKSVLDDAPARPVGRFDMRTASAARNAIDDPRNESPSLKKSNPKPDDPNVARGAALVDASLPVRAAAKVVTGGAQGLGGIVRAVGDVAGSDAIAEFGAAGGRGARAFEYGMGQDRPVEGFGPKSPAPYLRDMAEGAASSLGQSAVYGATLGARAVIPALSIQTMGQEYDQARQAGRDPYAALAVAIPKGVFEAVGEKFTGLDKVASAVGTLLQKGAADGAKRTAGEVLLRAGVRELPGEIITYLGQTGTDLIPGIGLKPDLTMRDFIDGLRDTVVQAGMMGGGTGIVGGALRREEPAAIPDAQSLVREKWGAAFTDRAPEPTVADITTAQTTDEAIALASAVVVGKQWQDIAPTQPADDLSSQRAASVAGQQWQDVAATQQRQADEAGAAASRATDARIAELGQEWQRIAPRDPLNDLAAQRAGLAPTQEPADVSQPAAIPPVATGADRGGNDQPDTGMAAGVGLPGEPGQAVPTGPVASQASGEPVPSGKPADAVAVAPEPTVAPVAAATVAAPAAVAPVTPTGPEVSRYVGKYGKGMSQDAAKIEATRLNRTNTDKSVTFAAEEHGDDSLANPWAVIGRTVGQEVDPAAPVALPAKKRSKKAAEPSLDGNLTTSGAEQRAAYMAAEKRRRAAGDRARKRAYESNPMRAFIAKHGIKIDLAREFAPGQAERRRAMVQGYGPIFRRAGLQLDELAQRAVEAGFLTSPDVSKLHNLIGRAIRGERIIPQYAEGVADQEMESRTAAQFEDHLSQQEAAPSDPLIPADILDDVGYNEATPEIQAEFRALMDMARELGIDTEAIIDDASRENENATEEDYYRAASRALQEAIARGSEDGRASTGQDGGTQDQGLTAPTPADILAQQDRTARADELDQRDQIQREAAGQTLTAQTAPEQRTDSTADIFGGLNADDARQIDEKRRREKAKSPEGPDMFDQADEPAAPPVASREGQMRLANRGSRIASLKLMNDRLRSIAPNEAWADKNIEDAADLDALQDQISEALVAAQRGPESQNPLRAELEQMSGAELRTIFDRMNLAGARMTVTERVDALMAEDEAEVRAAMAVTSPNPDSSDTKAERVDGGDTTGEQPAQSARSPDSQETYKRLDGIAERMKVGVTKSAGGWHASGDAVDIPDADIDLTAGRASGARVFAHELSHVAMNRRGFSLSRMPKSEIVKVIPNWDDLVRASKEFRPGVHRHENERFRKHAMKPDEIVADAIASVLVGMSPESLIKPLMAASGLNKVDLGLQTVDEANAEYRARANAPDRQSDARPGADGADTKDAPAVSVAPEKPAPQPAGKIDSFKATVSAMHDGTISPEDFKAAYRDIRDGEAEYRAELGKLTKDELIQTFGIVRDGKKAELVDMAYGSMLRRFAMGKDYGPNSYTMTRGGYENYQKQKREALDALVEGQTADDLKAFADEVAAERAEFAQRAEAKAKAIANPQTLADYESLINAKAREAGVRTVREALMLLTPEQREAFDAMAADKTREARKGQKEERQAVKVAGQQVDGQIIETKHTQRGHDLFVVQLAERVSREDYETLNTSAKQMGGYYSSFRGRGAVPGFQFKDRATADAFVKLANGDTSQAQQAVDARRDSFADDRSQTAVERLTEMAASLEDRADESLGRDRKANTERRARFAASAEASANADKAMARTMLNIAKAIDAGTAKLLDRVRTKTQIEMLTGMVRTAKDTELRAKHDSYAEQEKRKGEPATSETASYAEFPSFTAYRSDLASLARQLLEVDGTKKIGAQLMKVADDVTDAYLKFAKDNLLSVSQFGTGGRLAEFASKDTAERAIQRSGLTGKAIVLPIKRGENRVVLSPSEAINRGIWTGDGDKRITLTKDFGQELVQAIGRRANKTNKLTTPWQFETANDRLKALARMGIETPSEFRTALREFIGLQERAQEADRVKMLERAMAGRAKDGLDFFPTPQSLADEMVEAADIKPDMAVLEPSAGMGHIADRIRAAGAEPDVVEMSNSRAELLEAKGFTVVARDFMDMSARGFTYGDVFKHADGRTGILGANGGLGSGRYKFIPMDGDTRTFTYENREDLTGVEKRGGNSGYDRIVMNPPFSDRRDAEHVQHAYTLLRPGGRLVAIMGEGVFFGQDKRAQEFREWLEKVGGTDEKVAEGTFMDPTLPVNTGVNARMVVIDKPEDAAMFSRTKPGQTDTPAFKAWFGDSKVVDAEGRPLVVYHGTNETTYTPRVTREGSASARDELKRMAEKHGIKEWGDVASVLDRWVDTGIADRYGVTKQVAEHARELSRQARSTEESPARIGLGFSIFNLPADGKELGAHFGTKEQAKSFGEPFEFYLSLQNALRLPDLGTWDYQSVMREARRRGVAISNDEYDAVFNARDNNDALRKLLLSKGIDGVVYKNEAEGKGDSYIAFRPEQIKSATGNRGTFDPNNPDIRFRRSADPAIPTRNAARIQQIVDNLKANWKNAPEIVVLNTFADAPKEVLGEADRQDQQGAEGAPRGFYFGGKVYLVADQITTGKQITETLFHEALGHYGLRGAFGGALTPLLKQFAIAQRAAVIAKAKEYGLDIKVESDWLKAAEEVLAELAQTRPESTWVQKAIAAIRTWLRENIPGFESLKLTDGEIINNFIIPARNFVERAREQAADGVPMFQRGTTDPVTNDKDVVGKSQGGRSADDTSPSARAAQEILGTIERDGDEFADYGLRVVDFDGPINIGEILPNSRVWDDGRDTGEELKGTSTAGIRSTDLAGVTRAIRDLGAHGKAGPNGYYPGSRVVLVKGERTGSGEDAGESVIKNAEVVGIWHKPTSGKTEVQPNESPAPDTGGARDVMFSRSVVTGQDIPSTWQGPDASKLDDFIYSMQDKHIDTRRTVKAIRDAIGAIEDNQDPYLQEELYHNRAAMATKEFLEKDLRPLFVEMQARGVEMSDFEEYLHNRHAERRNEQVANVNPKMPDGGSGIKTADARAYLAALSADKARAYKALAARVDRITDGTRALLVSSGLEKQETIDAWRAAQGDEYVPLMREEMDNGTSGIGQGFSVRGGASKRAMGSNKPVANILANIALQREKTITRSEKRRIGEAVYGLALSAPNPDFWFVVDPALEQSPSQLLATSMQLIDMGMDPADAERIAKEPKERYIDPRTGLVAERINPALRSANNVLAVRIDGEDKYVFFNAKDPRAMRMVTALKNLDADQLGTVMGTVAKATRYFAAINTQYNPIFGVVNIVRDVQTAVLNLSSTELKDHKAAVMKHVIPALRGIYIDLRDHRAGKNPTSKYAQIFEEFQREGGATGYRDMFANAQERADAIVDELKAIKAGRALKLGRGIMGWLSDYNETMENAVRVSAYIVAKEQGMTNQRAASLAKNLTVNFNRKGQVALQAGALYAFFNASVQGTARIGQTIFEGGKLSRAGRKIMMGGLLLGSMQALLLAAAGFDDDEPPDFVRERSLVIPIGGAKYVSIPMPLGFHILPSLTRIPTEWALGGFKNTPKRISQMIGLFADAFNPLGSAGLSLQTLTPTIIDPLAALSENKDFTGKPIARKDFDSLHPTAGHTRAKDTATPWAKFISKGMNLATGGTEYKPGMVSPTPDQIDYLIGQVTGGVGRELGKAAQVVGGVTTGEDVPLYKIPAVGRFVGTTEGKAAESSRFYENLRKIGEHKVEIEGLRKDRKGVELSEYLRENREAYMVRMADGVQRDVSKLNSMKRELIKLGAPRERVKAVEDRAEAKMKAFNDRVRTLRESAR